MTGGHFSRSAASPAAVSETVHRLASGSATFFAVSDAAARLGVSDAEAGCVLAGLEASGEAARVCRDGWVLTWQRSDGLRMPTLDAYLHDMMRHLGVGYYVSYPKAAAWRGATHHGVMRTRVNVETSDLGHLELAEADGPADLAVSFHPIPPGHGRPVAPMRRLCLPPAEHGSARWVRRTVIVATMETALLDMVERPERCSGMDHAATIAVNMLTRKLLHPGLLAEASDLYEPHVGRRTGSMLAHIKPFWYRFRLGPLRRRVSVRPWQGPVEIQAAAPDTVRRPDRWGVTYRRRLEPDL